jgi:hypothetical protein
MLSVVRLVLALLLLTTAAGAGAYCDPATDRSIRGEFRRSIWVGTVRVERVTWLGEDRRPAPLKPPLMLGSIPGGFDPYLGAYYRVKSAQIFKGSVPRRFQIFSENTSARTPLAIGRSYLVFLYRVTRSDEYQRKGDLMIDYCGNSSIDAKWTKPLAIVRRLAKRS